MLSGLKRGRYVGTQIGLRKYLRDTRRVASLTSSVYHHWYGTRQCIEILLIRIQVGTRERVLCLRYST